MKMMDCVEVMVEKDSYAKEGVHKGMQGVVWEKEPKDGCWVVLFPQCGDKEDIADLYMKEEDLKLIPVMSPDVNEQIKAQFEKEADRQNHLPKSWMIFLIIVSNGIKASCLLR